MAGFCSLHLQAFDHARWHQTRVMGDEIQSSVEDQKFIGGDHSWGGAGADPDVISADMAYPSCCLYSRTWECAHAKDAQSLLFCQSTTSACITFPSPGL